MIDEKETCQRRSPRFKTNFKAKVEGDSFCIDATVTNLSAGGLQLECEYSSLQLLMPNVSRPDSHVPIQFHIHFQVCTQTRTNSDIHLICSIVYVRRMAPPKALLGCQFNALLNDSESDLLNYLEHFGVLL